MEDTKDIFSCRSDVICPYCDTQTVEILITPEDYSDDGDFRVYTFNECPNCGWSNQ